MPRRKQARHTDVKDIRSILRLTFEQELSIRAVSERLKISKTSVSTYLLRAREAGLAVWPLPPGLEGLSGGTVRMTPVLPPAKSFGNILR